ncbi:MAG: glycosyltransferase family 4 protein [Candidatus Omnitrophota bacterium]
MAEKVLHIHTRPIVGGSGTNTLLTMVGCASVGFDCVLACGAEGPLTEEARKNGLPVEIIPHLKNEINIFNDFLALKELNALMEKKHFTIVHTHNSKAGILGRLAARLCGVPVIVHTIHSCVFQYPNLNFIQRRFYFRLEKFAARMTDKLIAISDTLQNTFIEAGIAPAEKFITIYSGIELDRFRAHVNAEEEKVALGIRPGELVVGVIGRLAEGKGHEFVIRTIPLVAKESPKVKFIFVGDGPLRIKLWELTQQFKVEDKVIFTGQRSDIPELLKLFDVFCLASLYEGMGRVILEAQVAGKPVVATDIGGIPDVVSKDHSAILVKPKDVEGLSAALIKLLRDDNLRLEMSKAAQQFVDYRFSAQKMVEDIVRVYNELLTVKKVS